MVSWRVVRTGILTVIVCIGSAVALFLWEPVWLFHRHELKTGAVIIARIEAFQKSHGYLPGTLKDVGLDNPDLAVFYRKVSDDEYCVWFGTTLGESEVYSSRTRKWE